MWEKLANIDNRILYIAVIVCLIIPIIKPIGMAITVNENLTVPFYDFIEDLSEDDIVMFDMAYSEGTATELTPQVLAVMEHLSRKGVKIVVAGQQERSIYFTQEDIEKKPRNSDLYMAKIG